MTLEQKLEMTRDHEILEKLEKEISLKELQIKSLLTITQAINDNVSESGLYNMYRSFLSWEMGIVKMALFIKGDNKWLCKCNIDYDEATAEELVPQLLLHNRLHTVKKEDPRVLRDFDIVIPVFHKEQAISYALIGGIKDKRDLYNRIQFITTITNIIAVAIENKRLFRQQLAQERYNREMLLASEVQTMLIPEKLPIEENYQLASIYKPHYNIGGDYFDCIVYDKNKFAFCIADISGKGVAAALLMANFQAMIRSLIYQYRDLETFVFALNQAVYRITKSDKFITFFIAEIDLNKRELRYINAGHYPPLLVMNGEVQSLNEGCTVIGAFDKLPSITESRVKLENEAMILSFTDGLADLKNENGNYFDDAMITTFLEENQDLDVSTFNEELMKVIEGFKGDEPYTDDIAIVTCKVQ